MICSSSASPSPEGEGGNLKLGIAEDGELEFDWDGFNLLDEVGVVVTLDKEEGEPFDLWA